MKKVINWINLNPGAPRDECGYHMSSEGRFRISPNFRHTIYPDSYTVTDAVKSERCTFDRIRDAKGWAETRVEREIAQELKSYGHGPCEHEYEDAGIKAGIKTPLGYDRCTHCHKLRTMIEGGK